MLTFDFDRLGLRRGDRMIDVGCGAGRHAFEAYRRGADVVAFDQDGAALEEVSVMFGAMAAEGQASAAAKARVATGDVLDPPFEDGSFDCVIASEILEHVDEDDKAVLQIARLVRPGGVVAVSVPRRWPEQVCWALSEPYHQVEGGHVRIYRGSDLVGKLRDAGLEVTGTHHAHALHSPYWWLKCAVGVDNDGNPLVRSYRRFLEWDLMRRPWLTRTAEGVLNPLAGKSLAVYARKPESRDGQR